MRFKHLLMVDRFSNTTIRRQDDQVVFNNEQTQRFSEKDFVQVFNDNVQNYNNLLDQLNQFKDQREEIMDQHSEELARIHYMLGMEGPEVDEAKLEGGVSEEALQQKNQLDQLKEQIGQLKSQKERLEEQLGQMQDVAEEVINDVEDDDLELAEYEPAE